MIYFLIKVLISALIIAAVSELARRNLFMAAILASLPLTSVLAFIWLYREERNASLVADLSMQIFWLVIPSLMLFVVLAGLIRRGFAFWPSLLWAALSTMAAYLILLPIARRFGIQLY